MSDFKAKTHKIRRGLLLRGGRGRSGEEGGEGNGREEEGRGKEGSGWASTPKYFGL